MTEPTQSAVPAPGPAAGDTPRARPGASRGEAARIVAAWMKTGEFPNRLLNAVARDHAFVAEVVMGVARWRGMLEWVIRQRCARSAPEPDVAALLMVGLYQILRMDTVPEFAAVHETVDAAKHMPGAHRAAGFVNRILRDVVREKPAVLAAVAAQPLAVRESHPRWLVARWQGRFGEAETERLCRWNNVPAEVVLCLNPMRTNAVDFLAQLQAAGVEARPHAAAPERCVVLPRGVRVDEIPGYAAGHFTAADPSTLLAVDLLDPQPGETILDACAAPGGKTALAAARMRDTGVLVSADASAARLHSIRQNVARLALTCVRVLRLDAARAADVHAAGGDAGFDRVLVDAPCTNTGVLRRRPDARWRLSPESLREATARQRAILDGVHGALKRGGTLVYSVCSIEDEEGPALVRDWLAAHPAFHLAREVSTFPPGAGTDGGYVAAVVREA